MDPSFLCHQKVERTRLVIWGVKFVFSFSSLLVLSKLILLNSEDVFYFLNYFNLNKKLFFILQSPYENRMDLVVVF